MPNSSVISGPLFVAADGGATKTRVAITDGNGMEIGRTESGPSSLTLMGASAWQAIMQAAKDILGQANLDLSALNSAHFGLGLAGANNTTLKRLFLTKAPEAASINISTDAFVAVLGAHGGNSGGVVSVGTGSVGYSLADDGSSWQSGGWGYPADDKGSGAWIGHEAVAASLKVLDGRLIDPPGGLSFYREILLCCGDRRESILDWLHEATPTDFAGLAPSVVAAAKVGHDMATDILTRAGVEIDELALALDPTRRMPMALVGGLADPLAPYLPPALSNWVRPARAGAIAGALMLARGEAPDERLPDL